MSGVEVILNDISKNPSCPHGPTVLFSRNNRNFFACSACRDRKACKFFLYEDQIGTLTAKKKNIWLEESKKYIKAVNHRRLFLLYNQIASLNEKNRAFCTTCTSFVLPQHCDKHKDHVLIKGISDHQLNHPSEFLPALDDPKKEAQFLFSKHSVGVLIKIIQALKFTNVICMGTPRLYEHVKKCTEINSLLLDFDKRFHSFYGPLEYCWYNCFNNHFFTQEASDVFREFITGLSDLLIILDPPFGGRVELLANTLRIITEKANCRVGIFFIFPYFMEPQILNSLPEYKMLDYKVDYDNHPLFQDGPKGRKLGSPVRIFTNLDPSTIPLPEEEGYKFCRLCKKWSSQENTHCDYCEACASKDGSTYKHCLTCDRCVKPTWQHCDKCQRCAQVDHTCGSLPFLQNCFHCKNPGHKKRDCPSVNHEELRKKRKADYEIKPIRNKKIKKNTKSKK